MNIKKLIFSVVMLSACAQFVHGSQAAQPVLDVVKSGLSTAYNNKGKLVLLCLLYGGGWRLLHSYKTNDTDNLAYAIQMCNQEGIDYWMSLVTPENVDKLCFVENGYRIGNFGPIPLYKVGPYPITALQAAVQYCKGAQRAQLIDELLWRNADPNKIKSWRLGEVFDISPMELQKLLEAGLDVNKKHERLWITQRVSGVRDYIDISLMNVSMLEGNKDLIYLI